MEVMEEFKKELDIVKTYLLRGEYPVGITMHSKAVLPAEMNVVIAERCPDIIAANDSEVERVISWMQTISFPKLKQWHL